MVVNVKTWHEISNDSLSFEIVKTKHLPTGHYRFTKDGYPGGAHFVGTLAVPAMLYVLEGAIVYTIDGQEISLEAGDVAEFDSCKFICDVPIDRDVKFVRVVQLPEKFRK